MARALRKAGEIIICAETALPAKFSETITEAVGNVAIARPAATQNIESLPQYVTVLDNDASLVKAQIEQFVQPQ